MPQYLSIDGLRARHGSDFLLNTIVGEEPYPDEDVAAVNRAITDAEARVDSYLGVRNKLPLAGVSDIADPESNADVPEILRGLVADIAIYRLSVEHDQLTKEKRRRFDDACKWLEQYAKSEVSLGIEAPPESSIGVKLSTQPRVLSRCETDGLL